MKNSSVEELMHAIETVLAGDVYASPAVTALAMRRFVRRGDVSSGVDALSDRELAVFSLIAAERSPGKIAKELGISRKTVETHFEHIKLKLGYADAEALKRGARKLLGAVAGSPERPLTTL
jgi:two-component system nitrate/nitrite response regulator NarL